MVQLKFFQENNKENRPICPLVQEIAAKVRLEGIEMKSVTKIGRFALVCLDVVKQEKPSLIVSTRSKRPEWVKRVFGSPVNELIEKAGCPVLVV
jgi:nucleotide-binding universal stress UspA family protein